MEYLQNRRVIWLSCFDLWSTWVLSYNDDAKVVNLHGHLWTVIIHSTQIQVLLKLYLWVRPMKKKIVLLELHCKYLIFNSAYPKTFRFSSFIPSFNWELTILSSLRICVINNQHKSWGHFFEPFWYELINFSSWKVYLLDTNS